MRKMAAAVAPPTIMPTVAPLTRIQLGSLCRHETEGSRQMGLALLVQWNPWKALREQLQ